MTEFGHYAVRIPGCCFIDGWGVGPFIIEVYGKQFRFEDSDRFGPALVDRNGDQLKKHWPSPRSPFWYGHKCWVAQGRRIGADGVTCLWDDERHAFRARSNG